MDINVEMNAFNDGKIRTVNVPDEEMTGIIEQDLELVFKYGQNDFQPKPISSVSVDDVVVMPVGEELERWKVASLGFVKI